MEINNQMYEFIENNLQNLKKELIVEEECGRIINIHSDVITIVGLNNAFLYEIIELTNIDKFDLNKQYAMIVILNEHTVTAICFKKYNLHIETTIAKRTHKFLNIMVSESMLGHIFNGYGQPLNDIVIDKGILKDINITPPTILNIKSNNTQLITGTPIIDIFIPLAYGQRQALIGDTATGKTTILTNIIQSIAHRNKTICIYISIGQNITNVKIIENKIKSYNCTSYIIISVPAGEYSLEKYLSPQVGLSIAEYFKELNYDVIVFIDDMNNHILAYQDIMLRIKQTMGKEGWPADIFYQHALILSMGHVHKNGGSITIIPVVVSLEEDISDYLITNIMSITDGQIVMSNKLAQMGQYPAINIKKSVSRIGRSIQNISFKNLSTQAVNTILKYNNLQELAILSNNSSLDTESQRILSLGKKIYDFLYDGESYDFMYQLMALHMYISLDYETINKEYLRICIKMYDNTKDKLNDIMSNIIREYNKLLNI